ncbi:Methyltransferase domain-containing protein [Virgibacillus subterraneus]|uniref:Methyltransferase domain-containing protein n=2 Tax=Virgibacillus TaxID=84406 RepID=A0A1H1FXL5_9BACI|nr:MULTISPECIES: class I SAM-dependent methyltransferase [Virgibacillus]SDR05724.1 Methyltransferase domain-containing protein [Virgibacillus salinus]SEQ76907.1 Methyltransferase domain-containing protein [Virgibacillus subterraneus]
MEQLFSQFAMPRGRVGQLVGWFMSKENREINKWTIDFLSIKNDDHILEIGFGSGKAIKYILEQKNSVTITGIDPSEAMVHQALRKSNKRLVNGQIRLIEGYVEEISALPQKVDKVLVINNITFWREPLNTLTKIRRQMNEGGKIAITIRPHEKGATDETSEIIGGQLTALLDQSGFTSIETFIKPTKPNDTVCSLGIK